MQRASHDGADPGIAADEPVPTQRRRRCTRHSSRRRTLRPLRHLAARVSLDEKNDWSSPGARASLRDEPARGRHGARTGAQRDSLAVRFAAPQPSCRHRGAQVSSDPSEMKTMQGKRNASGSTIATGSANRASARPRDTRPAGARHGSHVRAAKRRRGSRRLGRRAWRTPEELVEGEARTLRDFFESPDDGSRLLIAEAGERAAGIRADRGTPRLLYARAARPRRHPGRDGRRRRTWRRARAPACG